MVAVFLMISCSDDDGGTSGGTGTAAPAAQRLAAEVAKQSGAQTEVPAETQGTPAAAGSNNFDLLFQQTTQNCADCGIWFDSAELVIQHSAGTYTHSKSGGLLIKLSSGKLGRFTADLSSIPASATIQNATLWMLLNTHEGIAGRDNSSVIEVYDFSSGRKGELVRTITAAQDIKGRGYSKANPNVPIDFTDYARQVHGQ